MSADDPKPEDVETPETPAAQDAPESLDPKPEDEAPAEETAAAEAPAEEQEAAEEAPTEEPAAEAKPKPKRKPAAKKKAEPKADADTDVEADADADAEEAPKPKRTRAKKAEEPKAEEPKAAPKRDKVAANGDRQVVRAHAKYVRTSARKARLVCDHLRGKSVEEARAILLHTPRHVARDWSKLLESAVANAEHNHELVGDELRILSITADEGPTIKRFRPRAMGRASRIRKRTAHLSISLTSKES